MTDPWGDDLDVSRPTTFGNLYPSLAPLSQWHLSGRELVSLRDSHAANLEVEWFARHGVRTVGDILALRTDAPFDWPGFGVTKVKRLAAFVERLDTSATALLTAQIPTRDDAAPTPGAHLVLGPATVELTTLIEWARFSTGATTLREVIECLAGAHAPDDVQQAVNSSLEIRVPEVELDPLGDLGHWIISLDDRDVAILRQRLIRFEAATLDDIGAAFDVTRERIRQVESKLKTRLTDWVASEPGRSVRWALHLMARGLGACAPDSEVPLVGEDGGHSDEFGLLLYLAGMVWDRDRGIIQQRGFTWPKTPDLPLLDDGPLIDEQALQSRLRTLGVAEHHVTWAIENLDGVRRLDGALVLWPRNLVEQGIAVLTTTGHPMTDDEIAVKIGRDVSVRGLRNRLMDDARITRVTKDDFALAEWGLPAYEGIVSSMIARLEEVGPTSVRELADHLQERHSIKPGSVYAYSASPVFAGDSDRLRLRRADEPFMPSLDPSGVRGLYRLDATRLAWHVVVDHDVLRGSGRACPAEIATAIGVFPGRTETLTNEVRDVKIGWTATTHMGPNISSLRAHAEAVEAGEGDVLRLVIDRGAHQVSVERFDAEGYASPREQLAALLDLDSDRVTRLRVSQAVFAELGDLDSVLDRRGDARLAAMAALAGLEEGEA